MNQFTSHLKPMKRALLSWCAGLILFSNSAHAFTLLSNLISTGWEDKELEFQVNVTSCTNLGVNESKLTTAVTEAINLWNSVPTSRLKLKRGADTTNTGDTSPPTIYCSNSMANPDAVYASGSIGTLRGGRPTTGSITLNGKSSGAAYFGDSAELVGQVVLAHEMGHVLGLGHSSAAYALMYYSVSDKTAVTLAQDDMDGISWLYPRSEPADGVLGCGTLAAIQNRSAQWRSKDGSNPPPAAGNPSGAASLTLILIMSFLSWRIFRSSRTSIQVHSA